ncbi:MAG: response regulator, partial [Chitinivibrionales bacterium]|nr:response regulator [Chitinivibrionales bacterium]
TFLVFAFFVFCVTLIEFFTHIPLTPRLELIFTRLVVPFFLALGFLFLNFIFALLNKKRNFLYYGSLLLVFACIVSAYFSPDVQKDILASELDLERGLSATYIQLILFAILVPGLYAIFLCFTEMEKKRESLQGKQLLLICIGAIISILWMLATMVVLPSFLGLHDALLFSTLGLLMQLYFIYRAIYKYHLLSANIEQLEQSFNILFKNVKDAILLFDKRGNILQANASACTLFGDPKDRITISLLQERIKGYAVNREYQNEPFTITCERGSRHLLLSQTMIKSKGSNLGTILLIRDISTQMKTEQELQKAQNMEALGQLAGGIAHDFNNFLAGIMASFSLASMELQENEEIAEILSQGEKAALNASSLTKQLLAFSKGGAPINEFLQIKEVVKDASTFASRGSKARLQFDFPDQDLTVKADKGQLNQVFQNLILNAIQAMPGGGPVTIKIRRRHVQENSVLNLAPGSYVEIMIEDQGEGIPSDIIDKVFDPYFTTKDRGSGLGLSMAFSILINHGGSIFVSSEQGVGTVFTVYLPEEGMEKQLDVLHRKKHAERDKNRILIMEDDHVIRNILKKILVRFGYEVDAAINGEEALEIYNKRVDEKESYYAVLADLTIPGGMGGVKLAEELHKKDPELKIIICSGYAENEEIAYYEKFGFFAAIRKPYSIEKLKSALDSVSET